MKSGPKLMNLQSDINSLGKILADRSEFENDVIPEVEVNNEILVNGTQFYRKYFTIVNFLNSFVKYYKENQKF